MNRFRRRGFAIFLVWALLCLAVGGGTAAYLRTVWSHEESATLELAETAADLTEQTLLRAVDGLTSALEMVRARTELASWGDHEAVAVIENRLEDIAASQRFGIRAFSFIDRQGVIQWTLRGQPVGTVVTDREVWQRVVGGGEHFVMAPPVASRATGYWISLAGLRLFDSLGETTGMAVVAFDPLHLGRMLATVAGRPGRVLLVRHRSNGQIHAASHDPDGRLARVAVPDHPVVNAARLRPQGRLAYASPNNGRAVLTAYRNVGTDFTVQASFDADTEVAANFRRVARPVMGATALFIIGSLVMALAWSRNADLRQRLEQQATVDPLTGLFNRRALEQRIGHLLAQPQSMRGFACLLFDVDHFKRINDRFGHAIGDEVLQQLGSLLRSEVRHGDIVCRWGGEEMLVILPGCAKEQAVWRAEALRMAIGGLAVGPLAGMERITASVGVACYPQDGATLAAVVRAADAAMYRAKRGGRNRVAMVEEALAA